MAKQAFIMCHPLYLMSVKSCINWTSDRSKAARFVVNSVNPERDLGYILAAYLCADLVLCDDDKAQDHV